jgi:hypothetical protein
MHAGGKQGEERPVSQTAATEMNYLGDPHRIEDGEALHYLADFSGSTNVLLSPAPVAVREARGLAGGFALDREGIVLARAPTAIRSFADADAMADRYRAECCALIRDLTGAVEAFGVDVHCRFHGAPDPAGRYDNRPTLFVHADYSDRSAQTFAAAVSPLPIGQRRWAIYNFWRVVTPPPQSMPLALCDAASIAQRDEVETTVIMAYPDRDHVATQTTLYRPSADHRWYYFADMEPDEVLIFKSHDSDPARARRVPHCAFVDERCPAGGARISVETRVLALFD